MFDNWFTTVDSREESPDDSINSAKWTDLFSNGRFFIEFDGDDPIELEDERLSDLEKAERHEKAITRIQFNWPLPSDMPPVNPDLPKDPSRPVALPSGKPPSMASSFLIPAPSASVDAPPASLAHSSPVITAAVPRTAPPAVPPAASLLAPPHLQRKPRQHVNRGSPLLAPQQLRSQAIKLQSGRTVGGSFKGLLITLTCFSALLANESVMSMAKDFVGQPRAYSILASFCGETCTFDNVDFFSYKAATASKLKAKKSQDPEYPSPWQALASLDANAWRNAMNQEIDILMKLGT